MSYLEHKNSSTVIRLSSRHSLARTRYNLLQNSDCAFILKNNTGFNNVTAAQIISFNYTNSIYNVQAGRNKLTFHYNNSDQQIQITPGHYDLTELLTRVRNSINHKTGTTTVSAATYSLNTGKVTITALNGFSIHPTPYYNRTDSVISWLLGFRGATPVATSAHPKITGDTCADIRPIKKIYINSPELSCNNTVDQNSRSSDLIYECSISGEFGDVIESRSTEGLHTVLDYDSLRNCGNIHIQLRDHVGNPIELNGTEWELVVKFYFIH